MHSTEVSILASHQAAPGSIPSISRGKIIDVAEANKWLEDSGQWPENFNGTHLVLASGKLVLPKLGFARHLSLFMGFQPKYNSPALSIAPVSKSYYI